MSCLPMLLLGVITFSSDVNTIQSKAFDELYKKTKKYVTVGTEKLDNSIKYYLNLPDTDLVEIEAYLEITDNLVIFTEKVNGKWEETILKKLKSRMS